MIVRRLRQHQRPSDGQAPEPEKKRREPARPTPPVTLAPVKGPTLADIERKYGK